MNKNEEKVFPVFTYGIYAIALFSTSLLLLQSSRFAITLLPHDLSRFAEFFPGPAWKITSLYAHDLPGRAENYRAFFTLLVIGNSFVFLATLIVCLYRTANERFFLRGKPENISIIGYLFIIIMVSFFSYMLFFAKYVAYNSDFIFIDYNINDSNLGYVIDIGGIVFLYAGFSLILYWLNKRWHSQHGKRG